MNNRSIITLAALFCICAFAKAQSYTVTGTLKDKVTAAKLEAATVFLETVKDSTLLTYTITNQEGAFTLEGRSQEPNARVNISFIGYDNYTKVVDLNQGSIDLGDIELATSVASLDEVVVKSRAPITIKKDTLEFNVKSFKTKKDANIEDLLKELPGVEVDEDGKIRVNGKEVNKILVNGKPFFGDDPTIATRNLTKEMVEKIQVTDTKTDDEAFAGEEGDSESKTINLTIAEENNKGTFGRVAGGVGTDDRFEYAGLINFFNNDQRVSVLAGGNNINSAGFSFGEIRKMFGGGNSISVSSNGSFAIDGRSFGGGQGIVNSRSIGANYADDITEKFDVTADYFYAGASSFDETRIERENILPDRRFFTNSTSRSDGQGRNHDFNTQFNIKVDSTFLINIRPSIEFATDDNRFVRDEQSLDEAGNLINTSATKNVGSNTGRNFENTISLTKRLDTLGSFIKFRLQNEINRQTSEDFINNQIEIFGDNPETISRNQFTDGETNLDGYNLNLTYRYPLIAKKLFLDADFGHRDDRRSRRRSTFDFDQDTDTYSIVNTELSTDFEGQNMRTTPKLSVAFNNDKLRVNFGAGYVFRTLANEDNLRPELNIEENFEALELNSNLSYRFNPKMSIYANYRKNNTPPEVSQLNPFIDVSDPLNITQGNPDLNPSNVHSFYMGFNNYDFQKGGGYYFNANGSITDDAVVAKTIVDENLVRFTTFENVDGNYNISGGGGYNKNTKIDSLRTIRYGAGVYASFNRNINFNNEVQYASETRSISPNANISFTWKDLFEIRPRYSLQLSNTQFGIDAFDDQDFTRHSLNISTAVFVPRNVEWRNDIQYNYNPNVAAGFQRSAWFWNTTVAYSFLKDKATLTFKVYDVLNQNTNARRTANANFIQDVQSTVLQQYFMLSFSYKFNTLGKAGETGNDNFFFF
ncbi:MAG: outer membrane beta-barrel protein [Dokdonia sp.]|jgi:hypothetical protein